MKKIMSLGLAGIAVVCMSVAPAIACDKGDAAKADASKASAQTASAGSGCCAKGATAKMASAHGSCAGKTEGSSASADKATGTPAASGTMSASSIEECAKLMGMTSEECAKLCGSEGKMTMVNMNVKGMTCGGCESSVSAALQKVDGVLKVVSVSHKDGTALVCIDPTKTKPETLATVVTNKGYEAEVIPAVATSAGTGAHATCTAAQKAACGAKEAKVQTTGAEGTK